jgi:hypothetical protein
MIGHIPGPDQFLSLDGNAMHARLKENSCLSPVIRENAMLFPYALSS